MACVYDDTGLERVPFDGRTGSPPASRTRRLPEQGHGPSCRPADPEVGCECGEDERQELDSEARSLGFRSYDALVEAMGPERMAALDYSHNRFICPNPRRCPTCSERLATATLSHPSVILDVAS
jgi:hypothetical protein